MLGTLIRWVCLAFIAYGLYLASIVIWANIAPLVIPASFSRYSVTAGYVFSAIIVWFGAQAIFDSLVSLFKSK
jgi:hypothetical protein